MIIHPEVTEYVVRADIVCIIVIIALGLAHLIKIIKCKNNATNRTKKED